MRPEDMSRQIDEWASAVHRKAEQYQALKQEIAEISSEATGANGAIRVEVGPSGLLTDLHLTEETRTMRASDLAARIMSTIRRAQSGLGEQITELMQDRVGEDTKSIETVAANYARQFPQPADDEDDGADGPPRNGR